MIKIWVIYERPSDFPDSQFVMRQHKLEGKGKDRKVHHTQIIHIGNTLGDVRRYIPTGRQQVLRSDRDDPCIVEWWF